MIKIDTSQAVNALHQILQELPGTIDTAMNQLAELGTQAAKNSNLFKGNGNLRKNIKFINDGAFAKTVIADTSYAGYVEFGNNQKGPKIYPVKAKALRFVVDGQVIFRKWVRSHSGKHFMEASRQVMINQAHGIFYRAIDSLIGKHSV